MFGVVVKCIFYITVQIGLKNYMRYFFIYTYMSKYHYKFFFSEKMYRVIMKMNHVDTSIRSLVVSLLESNANSVNY